METKEERKPIAIQNLMSINDYAKAMGKTRRTVYNWLADGTIKPTEVMGRQFIDRSYLVIKKA